MTSNTRQDGRAVDQLRPIVIQRSFLETAEGSCWIEFGKTKVLCTASFSENTPNWLPEGQGWVTAEYGMLPKSSKTRINREIAKPKGRTAEIQRLIGRSLRAVTDSSALGQRLVNIDCDVIQADGGTRTASVTGSLVAFWEACHLMHSAGALPKWPIKEKLAAVSVGMVEGTPLLDLCYAEDSLATVDMNVVMTESGQFVEIQGTGEEATFSRPQLDEMLRVAESGIDELIRTQAEVLSELEISSTG